LTAAGRIGRTIFLRAVSAWKIALLVDTGRIELDVPVETWTNRFLDCPGLRAVPLSHNAACIISSAAIQRIDSSSRRPSRLPVRSYDDRIARFGKKHGVQ
jgi:PIN domain nuclease of toxin-antitoxin system